MAGVDNAIYDRIPDAWWSDDSFMALLRHAVNPPRLAYFRDVLERRFGAGVAARELLDVGCGGGLLAEGFAALGWRVSGIDRSLPTLAAAREHARASGLAIDYQPGDAAALPFDAGRFNVVCCCDVLEHVDDVDRVVGEIVRVLKPGGVFLFDTINRTWRSRVLAIWLAQDWAPTRVVPRGVHAWESFVRPQELAASLERHRLPAREFAGLSPRANPLRLLAALVRLKLARISYGEMARSVALVKSTDLSVSYMGYACTF
jgi:2-polyprenyl-6-hydroxyphenyl methylase/3-demethylubiquinone-9 3-methyltransferase